MKKFTFLSVLFLAGTVHAQTGAQPGDLGGQWKMVGWTLPDFVPIKGKLPVLIFKGNQVSGNSGCNQFSGSVSVNGTSITFSNLSTTRMACDGPVMQQEQTFLKALSGQTLKVERVADSLTFTNTDGYMVNIRRSTLQPK